MSRAGILGVLRNNAALTAKVPSNNIYPNYSRDERPDSGPFVILRWHETTNFSPIFSGLTNGLDRAPRTLSIQVHIPVEVSTDFDEVDQILDLIDAAIVPLEHHPDGYGKTITCVKKSGRGRDLFDEGYNTITREATYGVLTHDTVSSEL